jgi:hypothetical protein
VACPGGVAAPAQEGDGAVPWWTAHGRIGLLLGALAAALVVVATAWWLLRPGDAAFPAAERCRAYYGAARTAADSAAADLIVSDVRGNMETCGSLRQHGLLRPRTGG